MTLSPFPSVPVATKAVAPTPISSGARIVVTSTSVTIQPLLSVNELAVNCQLFTISHIS